MNIGLATVVLIVVDVLLLGLIVVLRSGHPPGHDELNVLETGLRMLGSYGNPQHFLHANFLYDVMAVMHGMLFAIHGVLGAGWDQGRYLESYLEHRDVYLTVGRLLVVGFAVLLLVGVNRLATVMYGARAGLLAAGLLSLTVLFQMTSTALKDDVPAAAWAILSIIALCDPSLRLRDPRRWALAGALAGTAIATKYTVAPVLCVPLVLAYGARVEASARRVAAFMTAAALAFFIWEPYLFLDSSSRGLSFEFFRGQFLVPQVARHMAPRYVLDYLPLGMGMLLVCAAVPAALNASVRRGVLGKAMVLYVAVTLAAFMWVTSGQPRYSIVLAPLLCVLVAGECLSLPRLRSIGTGVMVCLALVLTWPANLIAAKWIVLLSRADTRQIAQEWIEARVPEGRKILLEGMVSGEPTGAPALVPVRERFEARRNEAIAAGTSGRMAIAAAARAERSGRARYDLVERPVDHVDRLDEFEYLVLSTYDSLPGEYHRIVHADDPGVRALLQSRALAMERVVKTFTPLVSFAPNPVLRFDWVDRPDYSRIWAARLGDFEQWSLGPQIDVYGREGVAR